MNMFAGRANSATEMWVSGLEPSRLRSRSVCLAVAQIRDTPANFRLYLGQMPGVLRQPRQHYQFADVSQDGVAWPAHYIEAVAGGELQVLLVGMPAESLEIHRGQHQIPLTRAHREPVDINQHSRASPLELQTHDDLGVPMY